MHSELHVLAEGNYYVCDDENLSIIRNKLFKGEKVDDTSLNIWKNRTKNPINESTISQIVKFDTISELFLDDQQELSKFPSEILLCSNVVMLSLRNNKITK